MPVSSFSCPHLVDREHACRRLRMVCMPGRPGCVLRDNSVFAIPVEQRLREGELASVKEIRRDEA
jgi:hypothetical protein